MAYVSQMGEMSRKAAEDGIELSTIRLDYRNALLRLQKTENASTVTEFAAQRYMAEHQTWDLNWPEMIFPGIDPRGTNTAAALRSDSNSQIPRIPKKEKRRRRSVKKQRTPHPDSPKSSVTLSYPEISLGERNPNKKAKPQHKIPQSKTRVPSIPKDILTCGNCGDKGHGLRICTRNIDQYGFLNGCPRCNTRNHNYAKCLAQDDNERGDYLFLIRYRIGKPPLRWKKDNREINPEKLAAETVRPQSAQFAAARQSKGITQAVDQVVSDPSWLQAELVGSQIHPLDLFGAPRTFQRDDAMQLDHQASSSSEQNSLAEVQAEEQMVAITHVAPNQMQMSASDIESVKSLLAILKQSEPQKVLSQNVGHKADVAMSGYGASKDQVLSRQNRACEESVAPKSIGVSTGRTIRSNGGVHEAVASRSNFGKSSEDIRSQSRLSSLTKSDDINKSKPLIAHDFANMASDTRSRRQPKTLGLISSLPRYQTPSSNTPIPSGPLNIPQLLYGKKAAVAPSTTGCANCKRSGHDLKDCKEPCGLCDRARHTAGECTFRLRC